MLLDQHYIFGKKKKKISCGSQIAANLLDRAENSSQLEVVVSFLIDSLYNFLQNYHCVIYACIIYLITHPNDFSNFHFINFLFNLKHWARCKLCFKNIYNFSCTNISIRVVHRFWKKKFYFLFWAYITWIEAETYTL